MDRRLLKITLVAIAWFISSAHAELMLGVQPNAPDFDNRAFYEELAKNFGDLLGEPVAYDPTSDWVEFNRRLLRNEFDVILLEPHIVAWIIRTEGNGGLDHRVLAGVPGKVKYHVVTDEDKDYVSLQDLEGKGVCTPLSPGLAAVAFMNEISSPVNPPYTVAVKQGSGRALQYLQRGRCEAMVVTASEMSVLKSEGKTLKSVFASREFPGWALTISAVQPKEYREKLRAALTNQSQKAAIFEQLYSKLHGPEGDYFFLSQYSYYEPYNILPGVVWGW